MKSVPWNVQWSRGVLVSLEECTFSIDPQVREVKGDFILISHAHSDHIAGFRSSKVKLASHPTIKLYEAQTRRRLFNVFPAFFHKQKFALGRMEIEVHNSGHILGSVQFHLKKRASTLTYTGDFNLEDTIVTEAAKPIECDELIIDATFGHPRIEFPPRDQVYSEILYFIESSIKSGRAPAFYAYSIGKAQELIALINREMNLKPIVDQEIQRVNRVYELYGFKFKTLSIKSKEAIEAIKSGSLPVIVSRKTSLRRLEIYGVSKAIATGLATVFPFKSYEGAFPLSNHSDFPQIVEYIERAKPKRVYTVGYFAEELAKWIELNMDLSAKPLGGFHRRR
ncbi:MAG: hypothetical protein DRN49_06285 [Thaumarchaeota archaeon]|nr:MAG: hypothetical protein DRN49_06285 [Nitrososphaerota archaeon]